MLRLTFSPASMQVWHDVLSSVQRRKHSIARWRFLIPMLALAFALLSAPVALAQDECHPEIKSLSISPGTIVETSTEEATMHVEITCNYDTGGVWISITDDSNARLFYYGGGYIVAPGISTDVQIWAGHGDVHNQARTYTVTVFVGDSSASAPITVAANVPALRLNPGVIVGGVGELASGEITMSAPMRFGQWVGLSAVPPSGIWYLVSEDLFGLYMWPGQPDAQWARQSARSLT